VNLASILSRMAGTMWREPTRAIRKKIRHGFQYRLKPVWARYRYLLLSRVSAVESVASSPRFHAGEKLVSVLLPSRTRPQGLFHAVSSLVARCDDPAHIEILIRLDDDDSESKIAVEYMQKVFGETVAIQSLIGPRREGYGALNEFLEELCAVACGDFLFLFNDDAVMDTNGWDVTVGCFRDEFCVLRFRNPKPHKYAHLTAFPLIHRKVYEVIGHFSKNAFCDAWMQEISRGAGIECFCSSVSITHKQRCGELADATALEGLKPMQKAHVQFLSEEQKVQRAADLAKVNAYLNCYGVKLKRIEGAG